MQSLQTQIRIRGISTCGANGWKLELIKPKSSHQSLSMSNPKEKRLTAQSRDTISFVHFFSVGVLLLVMKLLMKRIGKTRDADGTFCLPKVRIRLVSSLRDHSICRICSREITGDKISKHGNVFFFVCLRVYFHLVRTYTEYYVVSHGCKIQSYQSSTLPAQNIQTCAHAHASSVGSLSHSITSGRYLVQCRFFCSCPWHTANILPQCTRAYACVHFSVCCCRAGLCAT